MKPRFTVTVLSVAADSVAVILAAPPSSAMATSPPDKVAVGVAVLTTVTPKAEEAELVFPAASVAVAVML